MKTIFLASFLFGICSGHITLVDNYGAGAGNYFRTMLKIPHGTTDKETTKIVLHIPHGVLSVAPEDKAGWDVNVTYRAIEPYISHGSTVNMGPASVSWTATCTGPDAPTTCDNADHAGLHHAQLLELAVQLKLGCDFGVDVDGAATDDATIWMDEYTLWMKTEQFVSTPGTNDGNGDTDSMLSWTGTVEGDGSWSAALPYPSPYLFIYSTDTCVPADSSGSSVQNGMRWGTSSTVIEPAEDQEAVTNKEQVLSWVAESQLELIEDFEAEQLATMKTLEIEIADTDSSSDQAKKTADQGLAVSIGAIAMSSIVLGMALCLVLIRLISPAKFKYLMLADGGDHGVAHEHDIERNYVK